MIKKILKIKGLGKFKNFSSNGNDDLGFLKRNIIFGYNTYGKSTITTIFRSLQSSNQRYLQGKKSFDCSEGIVIDILDDKNQHLTLANGNWKDPNIAIFDNHFINNSVYIGDEIDFKHKSSLHGVFVGENVTQKVYKLKELRGEQDILERQRDRIKFGYTKNDLGTFDNFLKIKVVEDVGIEADKKSEEIKRLKNIAAIKQLISHSPLASSFEKFSASMRKNLDTSAEKNIEDHIIANWNDTQASKNFLAEGVALLNDNATTCVFCGQNLTPVSELIEDFKKVFGAAYKETQLEIEEVGEAFLRFDAESEMAKFMTLGVKCENILDKDLLIENKKALDADVQKKLKNLNHIIDCDSEDKPFKKFMAEITKLLPIFDELRVQGFSTEKQSVLEDELRQLKFSQYRSEDDGKKLVKSYEIASAAVELKKTEIDALRKEIDEETKNAIDKNHKQINIILKDVLKADFLIQKLSSRSNLTRSDSHFVEYEFAIDGHPVPISNKRSQVDEEPLDKAFFGNTLSDSDRRLLAIAFFIASLQTDQKLKDKIVVLDDPFSSFDSNRKDCLANVIIDIKNEENEQPAQIIVLTHDDGFLGRLQKKLPTADTRILKITPTASGSILDTCDVQEIIEEQYFKDIKYIKDSADNCRNIDDALRRARPCLERILRHKYYFSLDQSTLESNSISTYLDKISDKCAVKDEILKNNWHEHMHDQHEIMRLSEPEKLQKLKDFLEILETV